MSTLLTGPMLKDIIVQCDVCKARADLHEADMSGWDWFTGNLEATVHFCHADRDSLKRRAAYISAFGQAGAEG